MEYNINKDVCVTLTDRGIEVMKNKNPLMYEYRYNPKTRVVEDQLWVIMNTFGDDLKLGFDNLFEHNIINFFTNEAEERNNDIKEIKQAIEWAYDILNKRKENKSE